MARTGKSSIGACLKLSGIEWKDNPEFCPTLSHVVEPEVLLPGIAQREQRLAVAEGCRLVAPLR
jgi:hypothetical protein